MGYRDAEKQKQYQHEWYLRKIRGEETKTKIKMSDKELKNKRNERERNRRKQKRTYILNQIGNRCRICEYPERLCIHHKNGEPHPVLTLLSWDSLNEININEYVVLCHKCHSHVHWCMNTLNISWESIAKMLG